jgi:hypothetical protein
MRARRIAFLEVSVLVVVLGAVACGSDVGGGPNAGGDDDDDDGGAPGEVDGGTPGDVDGGTGGEQLEAELAGAWSETLLECAGTATALPDMAFSLSFDGPEIVLEGSSSGCTRTVTLDVTYDDAARSIRSTATAIDCVPAGCAADCGEAPAAVLPGGVGGTVAVVGDTLTLTTSDVTAFPAVICAALASGTPAVETFTREAP